jgi:hypothetical protein
VGQAAGLFVGPSRFWAYNCTWRVDLSAAHNFGTPSAWFYGYLDQPGPVIVNSRFDMVVTPGAGGGGVVFSSGPAPLATARLTNTVFSFTGTNPARRGQAGATTFDHNAYYVQTGGAADFAAGDAAAVVLARPPAPGAPSLSSPLRGAGVANALNYDQTGAPRPAGAKDIGPLAARPLPAPTAAAVGWGSRTATVTSGAILSAAGVNRLILTFTADVDVHQPSLVVTGNGGRTYGFSGFSYDPAARTATWTLTSPVGADRLRLTLDGADVLAFGVLPGDISGDGVVDNVDFFRFRAAFGTNDPAADLDGDGFVGNPDFFLFRNYFGTRL